MIRGRAVCSSSARAVLAAAAICVSLPAPAGATVPSPADTCRTTGERADAVSHSLSREVPLDEIKPHLIVRACEQTVADDPAATWAYVYLFIGQWALGDEIRAREALEEGARRGGPKAMIWLGAILTDGGNVVRVRRGLDLLERAGAAGEPRGYALAGAVRLQPGTAFTDFEEAYRLLDLGSRAGSGDAKFLLAITQLNRKPEAWAGHAIDTERLLVEATALGQREAPFVLSFLSETGPCAGCDRSADDYLWLAAERGSIPAIAHILDGYGNGNGKQKFKGAFRRIQQIVCDPSSPVEPSIAAEFGVAVDCLIE